jgi:hypothetical protein
MSDNWTRPATASRRWLVAVGSAVAVVLVVVVVGIAVGSGRHPSAASISGLHASQSASSSLFQTSLPSVSATDVQQPSPSTRTTGTVATTTPIASPTGPVPGVPAGGWFFCSGDVDMATCDDDDGTQLRQLAIPVAAPGDVSYNQHDGYVYYRELQSDAHGPLERISRVPLTAGTPQVVVQGPDMANETQVSFGSPVSSPDGNFLAYGQMTLAADVPDGPTQVPSPGATTIGPPGGPPNAPIQTRLVQIKIQNLHNLTAPPVIVPPSMVDSDIAAGPLLGWSADSKQLILVGPAGKIDALAIGKDGAATGVSTVLDPASVAAGCQVAQTVLSSAGDFFVVASCTNSIEVVKVHNGKPTPFGSLLNTAGWQVDMAELDTTGQVLALTWGNAGPNAPQCVSVSGSARIIDSVPTAIQLQTTTGCIFHGSGAPGGPALPASSP